MQNRFAVQAVAARNFGTMTIKRRDLLVTWVGLAAAAALLACGTSSAAPTLATHEKGHIDFVVATAPSVLEALHASTCGKANSDANVVLDRIRPHDIDYDAATDHGATQGARFPLGASGSGA
jgi:Bacterial protein of unknown function (DUF922)